MTTFSPENNNDSHSIEYLNYNSETKVFTVLTERVFD